jgi:MipA family protein
MPSALRVILLLAMTFISHPMSAQVTQSLMSHDLPMLELGGGVSAFNVPHYPASNQSKTYIVPFPAGILRGETLRADEDGGFRTRFYQSERYEIALSFGGALPIKSRDNVAREGMPNLPLIVEVGPGITWTLKRPSIESPSKWAIVVPLRQGIGFEDWSVRDRGQVFHPMMYTIQERWLGTSFIGFSSLSTSFASRKNMQTFFGIEPQYATSTRRPFEAKAGLLATHLSFGLSRTLYNRVSVFGLVLGSSYRGNPNRDSDLLKKRETITLGFGLIWWFWQSKQRGVR